MLAFLFIFRFLSRGFFRARVVWLAVFGSLYLKLRNYEKRVGFDSQEHAYYYKSRTLTSMTRLYKKFFPKFDAIAISESLARKELGDADYSCILARSRLIRQDWLDKAKLGTVIHDYAEHCLVSREISDMNLDLYKTHPDYLVRLEKIYPLYSSTVQDFLKNNSFIFTNFLYSELVVWDAEFSVAGQVDFITWNPDGSIDLWDWKTSSEINSENMNYGKFGFGFLSGVPDTNFYHYSLQLSGYAYIIEKNLGIKVNNLKIIHITPSGWKVHSLPYMKDEAYQLMLSNKE